MLKTKMKQLATALALSTVVVAAPMAAQAADKSVSAIEQGKKTSFFAF